MTTARPITLHLPKRIDIGPGAAATLGPWAAGFARVLVIPSRATLGIDMSLAAHGASRADLSDWAAGAHAIRRLMDNNPREMSVADVHAICRAAY